MNILVANNHLKRTGGTENYTYALVIELIRKGHSVEYFTFKKGFVSKKIEAAGVKFMSRKKYDLIIANHKTTIQFLYKKGFIIQTCHGTLPKLEQPSKYADVYVCVTKEVQDHLKLMGIDAQLIRNGIDCSRFMPRTQPANRLNTVLSLCQSEEANELIEQVCAEMGVRYLKADKKQDNVWHLEDLINEADLVVGIGRSVYDTMACGRTVVSFDKRKYSAALGDGYLNESNLELSLEHNCSGRGTGKTIDAAQLKKEFKKYNPSDGIYMRAYALKEFNIEKSVNKYLDILAQYGSKKRRPSGFFRSLFRWL